MDGTEKQTSDVTLVCSTYLRIQSHTEPQEIRTQHIQRADVAGMPPQ